VITVGASASLNAPGSVLWGMWHDVGKTLFAQVMILFRGQASGVSSTAIRGMPAFGV
jgi:hypothetical protein